MATAMIGIDVDRSEQPPPVGRRWTGAALCGAVALSCAGWAMAISWSVSGPVWWEEASARLVGVFVVVAGVVMWIRRPTPQIGQIAVLCGVVYYFQYLRAADGILFIIGFCLAYVWVAVAAHLALAWPTGTLEGRADRILVVCAYLTSVATQIIRYLVDQPRPPWAAHIPQENTLWAVVGSAIAAAMAALAIGLIIHRWIRSTPVRRRPDGPVWIALAVVVTAKLASAVASMATAPLAVQTALSAVLSLAVIVLIPVLYLIRWLHRKFTHQRVVALLLDLERNLESLADPAALQQALQRTLGDPTLTIAYPLDSGKYIDIHGKHVNLEPDVAGRSVTRVRRRGRLVAIIEHDIALQEQRQTTEAAVAATGLAMENARLYTTMQEHLKQIRTSRLRLAQTAFDERQRIQRDLHDDAQQRLVKVLMLLDQAGRQLAEGDGGMPADVSDTVRRARVELTDDGRGGAHPDAGFGLTSLRHRVEAVGGRLAVRSEPGKGTTLVAVLPRSM